MFRRWLSGYISKNKEKIKLFLKVAFIVILIAYVVSLVFSNMDKNENLEDKGILYTPQETVVSGSNVKQQDYEEDSNIVDTFIKYCNDGNINEAYQLLTEDCKQNLYPTIDDFSENYCKKYFSEKREYNLQSWINKGNYKTYQIRITDDILSTGNYDNSQNYQDYITIVEENNNKKININSYILKKDINKTTEKDGISINVLKMDRYMSYEVYTLEATNNTENTILLDYMKQPKNTLRLLTGDNKSFSIKINSVNYTKLTIEPNETKKIEIWFNKEYTSESNSEYIVFSKVVTNYKEFMNNKEGYSNLIEIKVEL